MLLSEKWGWERYGRDGGKDALLLSSLLFPMNVKHLSYLAARRWDFWTHTPEGRVWWALAGFSWHVRVLPVLCHDRTGMSATARILLRIVL